MQQTHYTHTKSGKSYKVIDHCFIQVNDEWVPAYIYKEADRASSVYSPKYVCTIAEFHSKFAPDLSHTETSPVFDASSILEQLRATQLWEILGKHKLF